MNNCPKVQADISAYLDDELTFEEKKQVEEHLANCEICSQELKNIEKTIYILRFLDLVEPPENFVMELKKELIKISQERSAVSKWGMRSWFSLGAVAAVLVLVVVSLGSFFNGGPLKIASDTFSSSSESSEQIMPNVAFAPEEQLKRMQIYGENNDLYSGGDVSDGEKVGSEEYPLPNKESLEGKGKVVGAVPDTSVGVLKSEPGDEDTEIPPSEDTNNAYVSQMEKDNAPDAGEISDSRDGDLVTAENMLTMSSLLEVREAQGEENESVSERETSPSLASAFEDKEQEFQWFLEVEVNHLPSLLEKIENVLNNSELEMVLVVDENKTEVDISVPLDRSGEIKTELELLIQQEVDKSLVKQLKGPLEEYIKTDPLVLIIKLSEY